MGSSLFISYSHLDQPWMQVFQKHLRGALMDRCRVWTDEDITAGSTWEDVLLGQLKQAGAGLVLASPDYLVSPWCRRELKALRAALKSGRLASVHWVQLRPCGWNWSELAELQAVQEPATASLEDHEEGPEREARVLQACRRITEAMLRLGQGEERELAMVRELISRCPEGVNYRPLVTLERGDFSIVCRGLDENSNDVVIKVLTNTPLHRLRELFLQVSQARQTVTDPSVVKVDKVFEVGTGFEARIVIISELAHKTTLATLIERDSKRPPQDRTLTPDRIGTILRRLAEALAALHKLPDIHAKAVGEVGYAHVMGPLMPSNVFYDERTERPQISLVGVTNFLWHFFDPDTFRRIVNPSCGTYIAPEKLTQKEAGPQADQYFLGMLALEMLEAERVFVLAPGAQPMAPSALLAHVENSTVPWTRHEQLKKLLCRLLDPDPNRRFDTMDQVAAQWRALEEPSRVLAKYSFRRWVEPEGDARLSIAFSRRFYERFFSADASVRAIFARAGQQRHADADGDAPTLDEVHHRKLIDSLKAVLNYRLGNEPSSIDSLIPMHHNRQITGPHFQAFTDSFIQTLKDSMRDATDATDAQGDPGDPEGIVNAWLALFAPVIDEMERRVLP